MPCRIEFVAHNRRHASDRCQNAPIARRRLRQAMKLIWWSVTLQLHRRFREWRELRQRHRAAASAAKPLAGFEPPVAVDTAVALRAPVSNEPSAPVDQITARFGCL
jgi:hypothetical protein